MFEEGLQCLKGNDFVKIQQDRGRMMIEAAAACGCPMAVAFCMAPQEIVNEIGGQANEEDCWNDYEWDLHEALDILSNMLNDDLPIKTRALLLFMIGKLGTDDSYLGKSKSDAGAM